MTVSRIFPNRDIVNGASVVNAGSTCVTYDDANRSHHLTTESGVLRFQDADGRYRSGPSWDSGPLPAKSTDVNVPTSGVAASVGYSGVPYQRHVVYGVDYSYSGSVPSSGNLKVESPIGTTIFSADVTASGPGFFKWKKGKKGAEGQELVVTLASGGANTTGKLDVNGHKTE